MAYTPKANRSYQRLKVMLFDVIESGAPDFHRLDWTETYIKGLLKELTAFRPRYHQPQATC